MFRLHRYRHASSAAVAIVLGLIAIAVARPILRSRVKHVIEDRCAAVTGGHCEIGDLSLERAGVIARTVSVRGGIPGITASIDTVVARFHWLDLAFGRAQGVSVIVSGVSIRDSADLSAAIHELRRLRSRPVRHGEASHKLRLDDVRIDGATIEANLGEGASATVDRFAMEWTRAVGLETSWQDRDAESWAGGTRALWSLHQLWSLHGTRARPGRCRLARLRRIRGDCRRRYARAVRRRGRAHPRRGSFRATG